jgi:hypothetical protein
MKGGVGSRLHRGSDGTWVAYARWPSRAMWEAAGVTTEEGRSALQVFRDTVETRFDPLLLQPIADYLIAE